MRDGIAKFLGPWMVILYFGYSLLSLAAMFTGLEAWWGWPGWVAFLAGVFVISSFPLIGTILGVMGAIKGWGWDWYWALLIFAPGIAIFILSIGGGLLGRLFSMFKRERY